jgi:hypothetical protein
MGKKFGKGIPKHVERAPAWDLLHLLFRIVYLEVLVILRIEYKEPESEKGCSKMYCFGP